MCFAEKILPSHIHYHHCVFIPSPVRVGTLLMEVPGTPIGASFFEFELKPAGKESADPTQHEFQQHIIPDSMLSAIRGCLGRF